MSRPFSELRLARSARIEKHVAKRDCLSALSSLWDHRTVSHPSKGDEEPAYLVEDIRRNRNVASTMMIDAMILGFFACAIILMDISGHASRTDEGASKTRVDTFASISEATEFGREARSKNHLDAL